MIPEGFPLSRRGGSLEHCSPMGGLLSMELMDTMDLMVVALGDGMHFYLYGICLVSV